ncbi:unnamed protein product [Owenia fusiformis]|uniref:Uncharacterized protein n=1 Tax=Owenia fusiformis TaxID=6347 RepID=A0A8J1TIK0_OWEFU|nr:unnamed protein product [Owenia fusiformis]
MQLGPTNLLLGPANMQPGPANMQPGPANMPTEQGPSWPANMSRPKNLLGLAAKIPGDEGDIFTLDTSINTCCGLDFPSKACMEHHTMVVHNRFCEVCNSRIDSDKDAANHGLLHKGVKAYQCQFCYKLLGSNSGLKTHMTPDVMCKMCNKLVSFTNRRRHICVKSAKK